MAGKKKKKEPEKQGLERISVCRNRKAHHNYEILDTIECGLVLFGSEVKTLRSGKASLDEAYGRVSNGEVWLLDADIPEYPQANLMNHIPKRPRKLLLKKREIEKFAEAAAQQGLTLVPLEIYFIRGYAKIKLAIGRGRQDHDKREKLKKQSATREMRQAKLS
ncbi:MAG TPA: SsrA-binding protein SmpB [Planctomycetaceae bacterium]|nr:SsrA-binding protein SmpB [Planctomycetaceae bacterium]HUG17943.1 SsrA-binding protein SmpB [Planctomycetaceae bacterium]